MLNEIENELREILKLKDERIKELEEVIVLLKTKSIQVPNLDFNQIQQLQLLDRVYNRGCQHNYAGSACPICSQQWRYNQGPTSGAW